MKQPVRRNGLLKTHVMERIRKLHEAVSETERFAEDARDGADKEGLYEG